MRGFLLRFSALLLIAFVAMGAQCLASCAVESCARPAQPPCHQSPSKGSDASCALAQAAGDPGVKLVVFATPVVVEQLQPVEPAVIVDSRPSPTPPTRDVVTATVLRI